MSPAHVILLGIILLAAPFTNVSGQEVRVFRGSSTYYSDTFCNVRDGKVYKGTSNYYSDIICNIRDGKIYKGSSNYYSDILFNFKGNLTLPEFIAVWYTYQYVY